MGDGKGLKNKLFFVIIITIVFSFIVPSNVTAGISLLPAKLTIDISDYKYDEIKYDKISVKNPYDHKITVKSEVKNPKNGSLTEGYSNIPDESWINIFPNKLEIPANSIGYFSVIVEIPEYKKDESLNKNWEVWACFFESSPGDKGDVSFNVKLATKVFINNPEKSFHENSPLNFFMLSSSFILFVITIIVAFMIRKNHQSKKSSVYYLREKENNSKE